MRLGERQAGTALALLAAFIPCIAEAQVNCAAPYPLGPEQPFLVGSRKVGIHSSHDLTTLDSSVKKAVILVHGEDRAAYLSYLTLVDSACLAQESGFTQVPARETILLAPHFLLDYDSRPADYHYWTTTNNWSRGSYSEGSASVSSFTVIDALIDRLVGGAHSIGGGLRRRFPNLQMIVVAGWGSGAELAHRYAATNGKDGLHNGVRMRYVVASPSSYLYLDDRRPRFDGSGGFAVPYRCVGWPTCSWVPNPGFLGAPMCHLSYNDWKFGLQDLNTYAGAVGAANITARLQARLVHVLVGTQDDDPNHFALDNSCPAVLQGAHRRARAGKLENYMNARFPGHNHFFAGVVGVGHDLWDMFNVPPGAGSLYLFFDF